MCTFGLFGPPNVVELRAQRDVGGLLDALCYQKDENVRTSAAWALGEIGDSRAVNPLIAALGDKRREREVAAKALGEIGDSRATDALIETLEDDNWEVRGTTAKALGKLGDTRAVPHLINMLVDVNANVRWHVLQSLETLTGESFGEEIAHWQQWRQQNQKN